MKLVVLLSLVLLCFFQRAQTSHGSTDQYKQTNQLRGYTDSLKGFLMDFGIMTNPKKTEETNKLTANEKITAEDLTVSKISPATKINTTEIVDSNWVEFDVYGGGTGNYGGITIGKTAADAGQTGGQPYIRIRADGAYSYMVENTPEDAQWAQSMGVYNKLDKLGNMGFCGYGPKLDYQSWGFKEVNNGGRSWWNGQSVITLWKSGKIQFMQPMEGDGTKVRTSASEPTAYMVLAQGSEAPKSAPLKFIAGNKLETPEAGAVEFDGSNLYVTDSEVSRKTVATLEGDQTVTGSTTFSKDVEVSSPNGVILTSPNGTRYRITVDDDGSLKTIAV